MINSKIRIIIITAFVFRLIVSYFSISLRDHPDIIRYKDWAKIAYLYGFADTYSDKHLSFGTTPNTMPPGSLYIISTAYRFQLLAARAILRIYPDSINLQGFINGPLQNFIFRLPQIFSDCLSAFLIYLMVKSRFTKKSGLLAMSVFLFHPITWYNSAFWGQMDGIMFLFIVLSLYFFNRNKLFFSILSMFVSLYIKLTPVILLPLFMIAWYKQLGLKKLFIYLSLSFLILLTMTFLISPNPVLWLIDFLKINTTGEMKVITNDAFNFWWMVFKPFNESGNPDSIYTFSYTMLRGGRNSTDIFFSLKLFWWGMILFAVFGFKIMKNVLREKLDFIKLTTYIAILALIGFLFLPQMHDRYLYPFFGLFVINWSIFNRNKLLYLVISICSIINLYLFWHPFRISFFPYFIWNQQNFQWYISVMLTLSGLILYLIVLKQLNNSERILR